MSRPQHDRKKSRHRSKFRPRGPQGAQHREPPIVLNAEGVPAAVPDAPRPSPVVIVAATTRSRYPWLPPRVIAGSAWRGPANEWVRIDEFGAAEP